MRQATDWLKETEKLRKAIDRNKPAVKAAAEEMGVPWITVRKFCRLGVETNPSVHTLQILELLLMRIAEPDSPPVVADGRKARAVKLLDRPPKKVVKLRGVVRS